MKCTFNNKRGNFYKGDFFLHTCIARIIFRLLFSYASAWISDSFTLSMCLRSVFVIFLEILSNSRKFSIFYIQMYKKTFYGCNDFSNAWLLVPLNSENSLSTHYKTSSLVLKQKWNFGENQKHSSKCTVWYLIEIDLATQRSSRITDNQIITTILITVKNAEYHTGCKEKCSLQFKCKF
jgi:hypothetical protein